MKAYYEHAGITIYHGDCREVLPQLERVDMVLTDPPYAPETHSGARKNPGEKLVDFAPMSADDLRDIFGMIRLDRWLVATMDWRHVLQLEERPPKGMRFVRFGIWDKPNYTPQFTGDRPAMGWEAVGILHAAKGKMRWNGGGTRAFWTCTKEPDNEHPTEKPQPLIEKWIQLFSEPGEVILDPFMGSGTTLRAAKDLGHEAIGIEIEEKYCEIAAKRMSQEVFEFQRDAR